jgi:hypothetical protein
MSERTTWPVLSCDICLNEIPASEAGNPEVQDYLLYLCGLDCYRQWREQAAFRNRGAIRPHSPSPRRP